MSKMTICPHYLMDFKYDNPADIENNILSVLTLFLLKVKEHNLKLVLSKSLYEKILETFPWDKGYDNQWKGFILDWQAQILPYLNRAELISHEFNDELVVGECCVDVNEEIKSIFESFLELFAGKGVARQLSEEAIFCSESCGYEDDYKSFLIVNQNFNNLETLLHPWLRIYKNVNKFPTEGQYTFVPPDNWRASLNPLRSSNDPYGYIDNKGKMWVWDDMHKTHWDVQDSQETVRGKYLNISPEGNLL